MLIPNLASVRGAERAALNFTGLNKRDLILDNEFSDGKNLSGENAPSISNSKARTEKVTGITGGTDFFIAGGKNCWVSGTNFVFDGVVKGTVTAGRKSMVDFNGCVVIMPDKKYYCYDSTYPEHGTFGSFTSPDMDYITTHMNRVFGCKGSDVYGSKWGDFKTWDYFEVNAQASWATDVGSDGNFIGIGSFNNHVCIWKPYMMYELFGAIPAQFSLQETGRYGLMDPRGFAEASGLLMFASHEGIRLYNGGIPRLMDDKIGFDFTECIIESDGVQFFVWGKNASNVVKIYVYDTRIGSWFPVDDIQIENMARLNGKVYALSAGSILEFETGTAAQEWWFTSKIFDEGVFLHKYTKKLKFKMKMADSASVDVFLSTDGGSFVKVADVEATVGVSGFEDKVIIVPMKRCNRFQIKVAGVGDVSLYGEREFSIGSEEEGV